MRKLAKLHKKLKKMTAAKRCTVFQPNSAQEQQRAARQSQPFLSPQYPMDAKQSPVTSVRSPQS